MCVRGEYEIIKKINGIITNTVNDYTAAAIKYNKVRNKVQLRVDEKDILLMLLSKMV